MYIRGAQLVWRIEGNANEVEICRCMRKNGGGTKDKVSRRMAVVQPACMQPCTPPSCRSTPFPAGLTRSKGAVTRRIARCAVVVGRRVRPCIRPNIPVRGVGPGVGAVCSGAAIPNRLAGILDGDLREQQLGAEGPATRARSAEGGQGAVGTSAVHNHRPASLAAAPSACQWPCTRHLSTTLPRPPGQ